jgi:cytoskeleton protein RodZ
MSAVENRQLTEDAAVLPGPRLAAARTAQNLSAADVARQLKLSVWQVEALEAGLYRQLPGPIFVRGFIRNYARLVKLDPDELVKALGDSVPPPAPRPAVPPSRDIPFPAKGKPRWAIVAVPAAVIVGLLAAYEFLWNEPDSPPVAPPPVSSAPQPARTVAEPATTVTTPAAAAAEGKSAATSAVKAPATKPGQDAQPAITAAASDVPRKPARRGEREVKLAFNQECWVEIRDRNERVIFSQLNRPGTQQSVSGLPPFSVVVGNAHGVQLTYDDKPVDLAPHTKIDVARLILQ